MTREEMDKLFEPGRYVPSVEQEKKLTPEQIITRGQIMLGLMEEPAWILLDAKVSEITEALLGQIDFEKDPMEVKKIQGRIAGIRALRVSLLTFVDNAREVHDKINEQVGIDE